MPASLRQQSGKRRGRGVISASVSGVATPFGVSGQHAALALRLYRYRSGSAAGFACNRDGSSNKATKPSASNAYGAAPRSGSKTLIPMSVGNRRDLRAEITHSNAPSHMTARSSFPPSVANA